MIDDLLQEMEHLFNVAELVYGPDFLLLDEFWESDIRKKTDSVVEQLVNLGHDFPKPASTAVALAKVVAWEKLRNRG